MKKIRRAKNLWELELVLIHTKLRSIKDYKVGYLNKNSHAVYDNRYYNHYTVITLSSKIVNRQVKRRNKSCCNL